MAPTLNATFATPYPYIENFVLEVTFCDVGFSLIPSLYTLFPGVFLHVLMLAHFLALFTTPLAASALAYYAPYTDTYAETYSAREHLVPGEEPTNKRRRIRTYATPAPVNEYDAHAPVITFSAHVYLMPFLQHFLLQSSSWHGHLGSSHQRREPRRCP